MKTQLFLTCALGWALSAGAESLPLDSLRLAGPYALRVPFLVDSTDAGQKTFNASRLIDTPINLEAWRTGDETVANGVSLEVGEDYALHVAGFTLENTHYAQATLRVEGLTDYQLFVDGKRHGGSDLTLTPATHAITIKYLTVPGRSDTLRIRLDSERPELISLRQGGGRLYTLDDVLLGRRYADVELSPSGKYMITAYRLTQRGGKTSLSYRVTETASGHVLAERSETLSWMPHSDRYYLTRQGVEGRELVTIDPTTGQETTLASTLPEGRFRFAPTEDWLLFNTREEGPKERKDIYQVLTPDDRQPGWRSRSNLARYDLHTGLLAPLTFGYHNVWATDISADGQQLLLMTSHDRLTARPTTLMSLYLMDLNTLETTPLVKDDGFLRSACFSPDGRQALISGSPEALGGIGKKVREGQTPSMVDGQLFLMDIATRKARPLTHNFNPSVERATWSRSDGLIYLTAENRDSVSLFRLDPQKGKIERMPLPEEIVSDFSLAANAPRLAWYGQSASNSDRLYTLDGKTMRSERVENLSATILDGVELGECHPWRFTNTRGDTIYGRYYLPPRFDSSRHYPMIVNYYGGCSPVSRNFESRYPHHAYAALGYVVYVIEPSGATGFGQEFSARHVNTAGEGVADDIIEGTRRFCEEHPFVDTSKIGCIGASYGGFMTQYLQTRTDLFAAAISHAGISDHTSYWGEGYWGYSYSEVSMANSYPWSDIDLYVKHSPLYNADKIHTPLLFLHGDGDTNVPVGESIQMFTALKLLGRETAFVAVTGENHHILDYGKRTRWQQTIFAWFAKYLQGDSAWWDALYPPKAL